MPQTRVEKKFFRGRTGKFLQNIAPIIDTSFAVVGFQEFKGILKNIAGGEE